MNKTLTRGIAAAGKHSNTLPCDRHVVWSGLPPNFSLPTFPANRFCTPPRSAIKTLAPPPVIRTLYILTRCIWKVARPKCCVMACVWYSFPIWGRCGWPNRPHSVKLFSIVTIYSSPFYVFTVRIYLYMVSSKILSRPIAIAPKIAWVLVTLHYSIICFS